MSSTTPSCSICLKPTFSLSCVAKTEPTFCSHVCHNIFLANVISLKRQKIGEGDIPSSRISLPPLAIPIHNIPMTLMTLNFENQGLDASRISTDGRKSPVPKNLEEGKK